MLFNSYEFLFLFAPITIAGYYLLGRSEKHSDWANGWLVLASLYFYSYWNIKYLPLLLVSIGINYYVSGFIMRYAGAKEQAKAKRFFQLGLVFNIGLLGFYKYTDFLLENLNYLGGKFDLLHIVLPLGISFFTITQIVYLVDCYEGIVKECNLLHYSLFVSFFPHLLAGPILYHKQMMKQFNDKGLRCVNWENMARGLSLFIIGMAKKVVVADSFVKYVALGFGNPGNLTVVDSWLTVICYMMQLYFDFSGYSDMAVGLARMLNLKIPYNFDSPYRAYGIINFWQRWHMSLTNMITNYMYTPWMRSLKNITFPKSLGITFVVFVIIGLWHGAGWCFIIFGMVHGMGMALNHIWKHYHLWMWKPLGYVLTLLIIVIGMAIFRAGNMTDALAVLNAMAGGNGVVISTAFLSSGLPRRILLLALVLVAFSPSSQRIVEKVQPNWKWTLGMAILFAAALLNLAKDSPFLYFQF